MWLPISNKRCWYPQQLPAEGSCSHTWPAEAGEEIVSPVSRWNLEPWMRGCLTGAAAVGGSSCCQDSPSFLPTSSSLTVYPTGQPQWRPESMGAWWYGSMKLATWAFELMENNQYSFPPSLPHSLPSFLPTLQFTTGHLAKHSGIRDQQARPDPQLYGAYSC